LSGQRLVVIGEGPDNEKVRAAAGPNVTFTGRLNRDQIRSYLRRARAFLFAADEDFGIAPVEAQACGTPVLAFARGGVTETIRGLDSPDPTGMFYGEQSADSLADAIREFERVRATISHDACRTNAVRFRAELFRAGITSFVERACSRS